jgi:hypothetical protein
MTHTQDRLAEQKACGQHVSSNTHCESALCENCGAYVAPDGTLIEYNTDDVEDEQLPESICDDGTIAR